MLCAIAFCLLLMLFRVLKNWVMKLEVFAMTKLMNFQIIFEIILSAISERNAPCRPPLFALDLWNMFNRTGDELPIISDSVEGWNCSFPAQVFSCQCLKFLNILWNQKSFILVSIIQHLAGHPPPPQRQRYLDCNRRILTTVDDFPNRQILQYEINCS